MNINRGSIGAFFLDQLLERALQYPYDVSLAADIRVGMQVEGNYITVSGVFLISVIFVLPLFNRY